VTCCAFDSNKNYLTSIFIICHVFFLSFSVIIVYMAYEIVILPIIILIITKG